MRRIVILFWMFLALNSQLFAVDCALTAVHAFLIAGAHGEFSAPLMTEEAEMRLSARLQAEALEKLLTDAEAVVNKPAQQLSKPLTEIQKTIAARIYLWGKNKFDGYTERYGRTYAIVIFSVFVLGEVALPLIPTSGFILAAIPTGIAELHLLLKNRFVKARTDVASRNHLSLLGKETLAKKGAPDAETLKHEVLTSYLEMLSIALETVSEARAKPSTP